MSTLGWTVFAVLVFIANIAAHEAGHALALRGLGGQIKTAGLGLPLWPCLRLRPRGRRAFTLTLSPWLLGAYVEPDEESQKLVESLRYRDQAWFAAAGVIVNFIIGCGLLVVVSAVNGRWSTLVIAATVGLVMWFGRRLVASYLVPLIGIAALVTLAFILFTEPVTESHGLLGTVQLLQVSAFTEALRVSAAIAIALGVANCLPCYPFDGGRVASAALSRVFGEKVAGAFQVVTTFCALGLIAYSLTTDVLSVTT